LKFSTTSSFHRKALALPVYACKSLKSHDPCKCHRIAIFIVMPMCISEAVPMCDTMIMVGISYLVITAGQCHIDGLVDHNLAVISVRGLRELRGKFYVVYYKGKM
jgi:hypothetical protein